MRILKYKGQSDRYIDRQTDRQIHRKSRRQGQLTLKKDIFKKAREPGSPEKAVSVTRQAIESYAEA